MVVARLSVCWTAWLPTEQHPLDRRGQSQSDIPWNLGPIRSCTAHPRASLAFDGKAEDPRAEAESDTVALMTMTTTIAIAGFVIATLGLGWQVVVFILQRGRIKVWLENESELPLWVVDEEFASVHALNAGRQPIAVLYGGVCVPFKVRGMRNAGGTLIQSSSDLRLLGVGERTTYVVSWTQVMNVLENTRGALPPRAFIGTAAGGVVKGPR